MSKTPLARLLAKVDKTSSPHGCWIWCGYVDNHGYGGIQYRGRMWYAHRLAWVLLKGPVPDGLCVLHNCPGGDNPLCCNPNHLWLGTRQQNNADMVAKGRQATGDRITANRNTASGDRHWTKLYPELVPRGDQHSSHLHPELRPRGDKHYTRTHPEKVIRGDKHYSHIHPEEFRGELNGNAKLTSNDIVVIRRRYTAGVSVNTIAVDYPFVTTAAIYKIVTLATWKHVK